jgi:putative protease
MTEPQTPPASGRSPNAPELLSPAGDWDCLRAAIENGADAVYFGLDCGFNARMRASNFGMDELPAVMELLHSRGLRGYITLNTLVFTSELPEVQQLLRQICEARADAILVQDIGFARLAHDICPDLSLHASTQMTLTSAEGIEAARELGIDRVVAARELSLPEIRRIRQQTDMQLEVFVHGALCVAYSGQCLTSESLGGRSANRGVCAQACRLPYELICDGEKVDLGPAKYLLSPQDLAAYDLVPQLVDAGVAALKIEGRLKKAEYVANITRHYRMAIDAAVQGHPMQFTAAQVEEMELSFSRGFAPGWLQGNNHKRLVPGLTSAKRGIRLGRVTAIRGHRIVVEIAKRLRSGDGVAFEGDRSEETEQGGRVFAIYQSGRRVPDEVDRGIVELVFARDSLDMRRITIGQTVWKTDDPRLTSRLRATFSGAQSQRRVPLDLQVQAAVGQPLSVKARAANGASCTVASDEPAQAALRHPLDRESIERQLGRLGATCYVLRNVSMQIDGTPMVPLSVLGKVRHELVRKLDESLAARLPARVAQENVLTRLRREIDVHASQDPACPPDSAAASQSPDCGPALHVLCRSLEQVSSVVEGGVSSLITELADLRESREAIRVARSREIPIWLATPRIQKPGEMGLFRALQRCEPDGILVRNLSGLRYFRENGVRIVADYSMNAANELTVDYLRRSGAERVTASYDLNREQLLELVRSVPARWLEVVLHQHMPLFHMEHCVFCAVLSPGTDKTNCGRPCDHHTVQLRDRVGVDHVLTADVGCRNTLFNGTAQSGSEAAAQLAASGVRHFRIELVHEDAGQAREILGLYRRLLNGQLHGKEVWRTLNAANRVGVTRGTLEQRRDPLAIL